MPFPDTRSYLLGDSVENAETINLTSTPYANGKRVVLFDSSGNEVVLQGSASTIGDGNKTVTTAGTRLQLSVASVPCKSVTICAFVANTGVIVVGGVTCVAASGGTRRGIPLNALDTLKLSVTNLNAVYIDSTVNGEGVSYVYEA